jgi:thioesterase domain-containing protein
LCRHPGLGTIDCYFDFSRHWPERHTIIAFEYQLYLHANTLPELALIYLKILKEQCPNKQYHFFGYSLGGQIAFEMVKLLEEQKRAYKSIAIFDAQPIVHECFEGSVEKRRCLF